MVKSVQICQICGEQKPIDDFVTAEIGYIKKYSTICASCREKMKDEVEGGGGKGKKQTIDHFAKKHALDKQQEHQDEVDTDKKEAQEKDDAFLDKKDKKDKSESQHKKNEAQREKAADSEADEEKKEAVTEKTGTEGRKNTVRVKTANAQKYAMDSNINLIFTGDRLSIAPHFYAADQTRLDMAMYKNYWENKKGLNKPTKKAKSFLGQTAKKSETKTSNPLLKAAENIFKKR